MGYMGKTTRKNSIQLNAILTTKPALIGGLFFARYFYIPLSPLNSVYISPCLIPYILLSFRTLLSNHLIPVATSSDEPDALKQNRLHSEPEPTGRRTRCT